LKQQAEQKRIEELEQYRSPSTNKIIDHAIKFGMSVDEALEIAMEDYKAQNRAIKDTIEAMQQIRAGQRQTEKSTSDNMLNVKRHNKVSSKEIRQAADPVINEMKRIREE